MTEKNFKVKVRKQIAKDKPGAVIWSLQDKVNFGYPDLLVFHKGTVTAIELKVNANKASNLQLWRLRTLSRVGIQAQIWTHRDGEIIVEKIS